MVMNILKLSFIIIFLFSFQDYENITLKKELLIGTWVNEDESTRNITRCEIKYDEGKFFVKIWGACSPQDCYWGEKSSNNIKRKTGKIEILWDQGYAERNQRISLENDKLQIITKNNYKDNSGRPDFTMNDIFIRE